MVCEVRRCCRLKSHSTLPSDQQERDGEARGRRLLFHRRWERVRVGLWPREDRVGKVEEEKGR